VLAADLQGQDASAEKTDVEGSSGMALPARCKRGRDDTSNQDRLRDNKMRVINEIAADEREEQHMANPGKIAEFGFATMTPRVRVPSGPPSI
jgi:hypothetical protein